MLVRRALHGLASNLSVQYNSIFATALGANPVQLGSLQSVGNAFGAVVAVPAGWVIDSYGLRRVFLVGTVLLVASNLLYFWADQWMYLYPAIILFYMGTRITCTCCTVTCATELRNDQRATGRGLCRSLSSVVALATQLCGNSKTGRGAYGTEGGWFDELAGIPSVIWGPGDIAQAHKPNEFISLEQVAKCEDFMRGLADICSREVL